MSLKQIFACVVFSILVGVHIGSAQIKRYQVVFESNKYELSFKEKIALLYFVADSLPTQQNYYIRIKAFCADSKDSLSNINLAQQRANALKEILLTNGFFQKDITLCKGLGAKKNTDKSATEANKKSNRIAQIQFIPTTIKEAEILAFEAREALMENYVFVTDSIEIGGLKPGKIYVLQNVTFINGKHKLEPTSIPFMKNLATVLAADTTLLVEVTGHVCCEAADKVDALDIDTKKAELSVTRAKEICGFLAKKGIKPKRLKYVGKGSKQKLVDPELTESDQFINSRIELIVTKAKASNSK